MGIFYVEKLLFHMIAPVNVFHRKFSIFQAKISQMCLSGEENSCISLKFIKTNTFRLLQISLNEIAIKLFGPLKLKFMLK